MPVSYYLIGIVCQFSLTLGIRFSYRFILLLRGRSNKSEHEKKVMFLKDRLRELTQKEEKSSCLIWENL